MTKEKVIFVVLCLFSIQSFPQNTGLTAELTGVETKEMVEQLCQLMTAHYVFPEIAEKITAELHRQLERGEYRVATYKALAERLSRDLKSVNQDLHLNVWSIAGETPGQNADKVDPIARNLHVLRKNAERGFDFKKLEILDGNIGYLELTKFATIPDPRLERMMEGAMDFLSSCSAVILDLRRNTGGNSRMIQKFLSYFFKYPVPLTGIYTRNSAGVMTVSTRDHFPHRYLAELPLFVLVSAKTVSGPEQVAYDLQVLKRAVIIGETTKGAANPSRFHRIKEKLLVCIPYGYAVNPITQSNWEGRGVTPDVLVPADSTLTTAIELAMEAAEKIKQREQDRVDGLAARLGEQMRRIESLLVKDAPQAERLFRKILDEYCDIEYMTLYLFLDWLDDYDAAGNLAACEMIGKEGIFRYPEEDRFYIRLGDTYEKKGDADKALQTYSDLLKLNPNDVSAKNKIESLRKKSRNRKE